MAFTAPPYQGGRIHGFTGLRNNFRGNVLLLQWKGTIKNGNILALHALVTRYRRGYMDRRQSYLSDGDCSALPAKPTARPTHPAPHTDRQAFEPVVWSCVGVLFFTGIVNIFYAVDFTSPTALSGAFMRTLLIKIGLFFVLVILTALHGMVLAPQLSAAMENLDPDLTELPPEIKPLRSRMSIVSSLMGVVSLLILLAAVALRMGI